MKRPRKAIVLAAGFGERLMPLTLCRPKPLCPIWGKPALLHALELLRGWGVREALINLHCHAGKIVDYLRLNPVPGLRCQFSFEPDILGTGGVLPRARWFLDDDPFWMMNADVLADVSCQPLLRALQRHAALAALWLIPDRGPRTVETSRGLIRCFRSPRAGAPGTSTFSGLHLISPRILDYLPPTGETSIVNAYERAMQAGEPVAGAVVPHAYWADIGTPQTYLAAHAEIAGRARARQPGQRLYGIRPLQPKGSFLAVGRRVSIAPSARVSNAVIWDDVTIGPGATVTSATVADGVVVRDDVSYLALRADLLAEPDIRPALRGLGWNAAVTVALPLPPRGSARTFVRVRSGRRRAVIVNYSLDRPENGLYAGHARFLKAHGIRVPEVLLDWPSDRVCALEDVGARALQQLVPSLSAGGCEALYRRVLDHVIRLHGPASDAARRRRLPLSKPFDRRLYEWEHNLFVEEFLGRRIALKTPVLTAIRRELAALIPAQLRARRVLIHRDLQSSNILIKRGEPVLIDFQGMRLGPAAYDLASLLCDPYVCLPARLRDALLDYYARRAQDGEAARRLFWTAAVQRITQALGAFGRLGAVPATAYFVRHIPAGVRQYLDALAHVGSLPTLKRCMETWYTEDGQRDRTG
jgi:NDP-sugar pyrophosphorylase family protein/aminoglycoside/choline kinase family phosphotransferase